MRLIAAVCTRAPDLPVIVTVDDVIAAAPETLNVRTQLAGVGPALNDPVTPAGTPDILSVTTLVKPFWAVRVKLLLADEPCGIFSKAGDADKAKLGLLVMVSAMVVLPMNMLEVPVTVTIALLATALFAAVNVKVLMRAALIGPNLALTPAGSPDTDKVTPELKLF